MSPRLIKSLKSSETKNPDPRSSLLKSEKMKALYKSNIITKTEASNLDLAMLEALTEEGIYGIFIKQYYRLKFSDFSMLEIEQIKVLSYGKWVFHLQPKDLQEYDPTKIKFMISNAACDFYGKGASKWQVSIIYDLYVKYKKEIDYSKIDLDILNPLLLELYNNKIGSAEETTAKKLMFKFIGSNLHLVPIFENLIEKGKWVEALELTAKHYFETPFILIFNKLLTKFDDSDDFTKFLDQIITGIIDLNTNPEYLQTALEQNNHVSYRIIQKLKDKGGVKPPYKLDFGGNSETEALFKEVQYNDNIRDPSSQPILAFSWLGGGSSFFGEFDDMA